MSKYYTPEIEEFHVGFEFESNYILFSKNAEFEEVVLSEDHDWFCGSYTGDAVETEFRVKRLDEEGIEDYLNKVEQETGKKWKRGRHSIKGDAPASSPWVEFVFEDASSMIFNEYLQKVLVEKTGDNGRGKYMVFNGAVKNISELKRILKQIGI